MQKNYRRLGDYIQQVDERNSKLEDLPLMGLSIQKKFIPSIANTIGTNMSTYKIIRKNQFAYGPVTSRNGDKITIALFKDYDKALISQAYIPFKIIDTTKLIPEYLMMWFRRPEFDRYARFKSHGSAREIFSWEEMCDVWLPIPDITQQQALVDEYQTIERRIQVNEKLCQKLEETAQALYRKYFVEDIDPESLPEGWRWGTIGEYCLEIKSGGTPNRANSDYWNKRECRWLKTGEVQNNIVFDTEEYISKEGMANSSAKLIPINTVVMAMYGATAAQVSFLRCEMTTNQACCNMICNTKEEAAFLFFHLLFNQDEIKRLAIGGAQENLNQELITNLPIIIGDQRKSVFLPILEQLEQLQEQNIKLKEFLSLLLVKMGRE
ncbi:MAG: restriction endonuclease subunit S [Fermentimonas sp.]